MTRDDIYAAIPHRPPFLFIDEIEEWTDEGIVCRYTFKQDEFFFQGHYPGKPIVPGVLLCESALQAGAIYLSRVFRKEEGAGVQVPVVVRMDDIRFRQMVRPGDTITLQVRFKEQMGSACFLTARIDCHGKMVVRFEYSVTTTSG